jgi:deoxyribose-phosphate aldolase
VSEPLDRALASRLLPLLDLTSLGEDDPPQRIAGLCGAARAAPVLPAAVCFYPEHLAGARAALADSRIRLATVVNFPDGGSDPQRVAREIRRALAVGANEIDMVLPYRALIAGDVATAERVVRAGREACGPAVVLKLILETGELGSPELIRRASVLGLEIGVDFLKTSTGKVPVNATLEAAAVMLDCIAGSGARCGFKAAGGIRTPADAARYLALADERMGTAWVTPAHFRIGASSLFDALCSALRA